MSTPLKAEIITEREMQEQNRETLSKLQAMDLAQGTRVNMGQKKLIAPPPSDKKGSTSEKGSPDDGAGSEFSSGTMLAAVVGGVALVGAVATATSRK